LHQKKTKTKRRLVGEWGRQTGGGRLGKKRQREGRKKEAAKPTTSRAAESGRNNKGSPKREQTANSARRASRDANLALIQATKQKENIRQKKRSSKRGTEAKRNLRRELQRTLRALH